MNAAHEDYPVSNTTDVYELLTDLRELRRLMLREIDALRAENRELRKLADLNALRRTLTNPTLRRITRPVKP